VVTRQEAVCIWEDHVGDSGHAPTDDELHTFALAVEEKARKPFVKLQKKMKRKQKEFQSYADINAYAAFYHDMYQDISDTFGKFAKLLKDRLDAKN
jgi:hypothetical protein